MAGYRRGRTLRDLIKFHIDTLEELREVVLHTTAQVRANGATHYVIKVFWMFLYGKLEAADVARLLWYASPS